MFNSFPILIIVGILALFGVKMILECVSEFIENRFTKKPNIYKMHQDLINHI